MRGALVGLGSGDSESAEGLALLYYAALEFIALQTRQIVDTMNRAGHSLRSVFMSGSQCRNDLLVDLIATACGLPVVIPRYDSAAVVHGAAMLGAKAASGGSGLATDSNNNKTEPLWDIMLRMTRPGRVVQPSADAGEKRLLAAKYEVMLDQLRTQREYRSKVDAAVEGWKM
ncbi:ribitol kinase [Niveomyces insectorum RCEF 264]|uniref:Ribitol kinase n=1 Tax=Niveomyces insectorum RCEF 264 TaxID=1081102 RepID=A0A162KYL0_9HYPO|nr:ribitol kinase [Niveomyces insectorum RCEF 264]